MSLPDFFSKGIVDIIENFRGQQQLAQYLAIVAFTVLIYDWILNIDLEVEFIWGHSWSGGRIVYHVNRILPVVLLGMSSTVILFVPSPSQSLILVIGQTRTAFLYFYGGICQYTTISVMLLMRCRALYGGKRVVVWTLCGMLLVGVIANIIIANMLIVKLEFLDNPLPEVFTGCILTVPGYVWILYLIPMVYECTLFILTTWRIYVLSRDYGRTRIMETLAHSGIAYFTILVGLVMLSCFGGTVETIRIAAYGSGGLPAISSVVCSHMIFSLHQTVHKEIIEGYSSSRARNSRSSGTNPQCEIPLYSVASANAPSKKNDGYE
ncbi:hypothetical protein RSOLAG1IB_07981 [Rhizoctonia solani AG-1 IB]|uniref:DUF6533 domain-containing protein n=1 Tax=Thanatephorus cucumeris (strain AG1-IB / isolate 7/3/14) TaxID=1108050 RepID=A0A0B7FGB4_THACB|nr:hypothetical protein RSOLAG1IB_07981 [Rhizoctonia solani AG-1 IB]